MTSSTGLVDVVVVAYRSAGVLPSALASVLDAPEVRTVLVVDNGDDGSAAVARELGAHTLELPDNPGFGAAQNRGVEEGSAPFLLLLNPDAVLREDALSRGLAELTADQGVAAVQGVVRDRSGEPERSHGLALRPIHLLGRALGAGRLRSVRWVARGARGTVLRDHVERETTAPCAVESLAAVAPLVRRSAFTDVGGFDPTIFLYGEDVDLCRRLTSAGWTLTALPDEWATHGGGESSGDSWERELHWWHGSLAYGARWWTPAEFVGGIAAAMLRWVRLAVVRPRGARRAFDRLVRDPVALRRGAPRRRHRDGGQRA